MPEGHSDNKQLPRQGRAPERLSVAPQHFYRTAALPCPYLPGQIERKLVTELAGRHAAVFLRRAFARRLPAQPSPRLPPRLRRLQRLRAGADSGRGVQREQILEAHPPSQPRSLSAADRGRCDARAVPPLPALSALAPCRQRHGGDDLRRLSGDDRGQPGRDQDDRAARRRRHALRRRPLRPAR